MLLKKRLSDLLKSIHRLQNHKASHKSLPANTIPILLEPMEQRLMLSGVPSLIIDLNGPDQAGVDASANYTEDTPPVNITDTDAFVFENTNATPGSEFRVNTFISNNQIDQAIAMNDAGDTVVVWASNTQDGSSIGIFGQRYDSSGAPAGPEFQVNTYIASDQTRPTVAMDDAGNFVVAWSSFNQDGSGWGIFSQRYDAAGNTLGSEFQVNTYNNSDQQRPSIAMSGSGSFVITWESFNQDGSTWGVFGQRYDATGTALGSEFQINTNTSGEQQRPSVSMDANNNFVVVWEVFGQDGSSWGVFGQRFDATGTPQGTEFQVNTYTSSEQRDPAVVMGANGDFVVTWTSFFQDTNFWGIYGQRFDASGTPLGAEFQINTETLSDQVAPSVDIDSAGNFVVSWESRNQDGSGYGIFAQRFDSTATPIGSEFQVNTQILFDQRFSAVAVNGSGDFMVTWSDIFQDTSGWGVYAKRYSTTATPATLESGSITITNLLDGSAESLTVDTTGTAIAANYDALTGILTLTGTDTTANYLSVIRSATYLNTSQNPDNSDRNIEFTVNNGTLNSEVATSVVSVTPVNDIPVFDLNGADGTGIDFAAAFTGASTPIVDTDATLEDVDSALFTSSTITITNLLDGADESLAADTTGTAITANYDPLTGILTLSGVDTIANYQAVLQTVTYNNAAVIPDATVRNIAFEVNDGQDTNAPLAVTAVTLNTPPVVDDQSFDAAENNTAAGDVIASDADPLDTISYAITGGTDAALFSINSATGELTFNTAPDYELPADSNADNAYEIQITVTDNKGATDSGNITVNVINEANVSGFIFADVDNDGEFDNEDSALQAIEVTLIEAGPDGLFDTADDQTFVTQTDADGFYGFADVAAGLVKIIESGAPLDLIDGVDTANTATDLDTVNDQFTINLDDTDATELNFAEQANTSDLSKGDIAKPSFWHNKKGQKLIDELDVNGDLTQWLLTNFDNIFDQADFDEYGGDIGQFFKKEFLRKKFKGVSKVDAEFLSVALSVFATSSNLSNGAAIDYKFNITETGSGTHVFNVGEYGAAFGVANHIDMTLMSMLQATNALTGVGADLLYDGAQDLNNDGYADDTNGSIGSIDCFEDSLRYQAYKIYKAIIKAAKH